MGSRFLVHVAEFSEMTTNLWLVGWLLARHDKFYLCLQLSHFFLLFFNITKIILENAFCHWAENTVKMTGGRHVRLFKSKDMCWSSQCPGWWAPRLALVHRKKTNLLSNKLIWRYLEFKKYKYTTSVLIVESGQTIVPLLSSMNSMTLKNQRITRPLSMWNFSSFLAQSSRQHPQCASDRAMTPTS